MSYTFLEKNKVIPVVKVDKAEDIIGILRSLEKGGIKVAEIAFRTDCSVDALELAVKEFPKMTIGAGTIINSWQCSEALRAGAKFIVSPGYLEEIAMISNNFNIPYIPGVVTPSEIMTAYRAGYRFLKFFPCQDFGGIETVDAYSKVFPQIKFVPTGGINQDNFKLYLKHEAVVAVGGTWMLKGDIEQASALVTKAIKRVAKK